jgi:hypothetical protein
MRVAKEFSLLQSHFLVSIDPFVLSVVFLEGLVLLRKRHSKHWMIVHYRGALFHAAMTFLALVRCFC